MRILLTLFAVLAFAGCGRAPVANNQTQVSNSNQTNTITGNPVQAASPTEAAVPDAKTGTADEAKEYLLTSAADDFHMTIKSGPVRVRDVHFGNAKNPDGTNQFRLCGEFLAEKKDAKAGWVHFVTLKTSGYEQYIGEMSASWCKKESVIWDKEGDLSAKLQSRLDVQK